MLIGESLVLVDGHAVLRIEEFGHAVGRAEPLVRERGVARVVDVAANLRGVRETARRGVHQIRVTPHQLAVPRIVDREAVVVAILHDFRRLVILGVPELGLAAVFVYVLALIGRCGDGDLQRVESLLPLLLVVSLGEVVLARLVAESAVILAVAVEERAGAIEQDLGLESLGDHAVDLAVKEAAASLVQIVLLRAVGVVEHLVDEAQHILETLLDGTTLLLDGRRGIVGFEVDVHDDYGAVHAKQIEVIVGLEYLHLRDPVGALLDREVGDILAQTVQEYIAAADSLIEVARAAVTAPVSHDGVRRVVPSAHDLDAAAIGARVGHARIETADPFVAHERERVVESLPVGHERIGVGQRVIGFVLGLEYAVQIDRIVGHYVEIVAAGGEAERQQGRYKYFTYLHLSVSFL